MFKPEYYQYYMIEPNYGHPNYANLCFLIHLQGDYLPGPISKHFPVGLLDIELRNFFLVIPQADLFLLVDGTFYSSTHILLCSEIRAVMLI